MTIIIITTAAKTEEGLERQHKPSFCRCCFSSSRKSDSNKRRLHLFATTAADGLTANSKLRLHLQQASTEPRRENRGSSPARWDPSFEEEKGLIQAGLGIKEYVHMYTKPYRARRTHLTLESPFENNQTRKGGNPQIHQSLQSPRMAYFKWWMMLFSREFT